MKEEADDELYLRCKLYRTTMYSCACPGYKFRRDCRHIRFLRAKQAEFGSITSEKMVKFVRNNDDAVDFCNRFGESNLDKLKLNGYVFERKSRLIVL